MCICFQNISPVSNSKWNWDCWPVMRMLPGLIKQLVLSKPIYGRMELQRSEFNICGGWLNQMLFNIQWYKQTFQMDYMKSMHAIHARWYCLHLCLWCFWVVCEEWVWIDLFSFQTGVVGEHIQRQCHSKPVREEAVLTEHESESGVTHTFTACQRGKAISTKTNNDQCSLEVFFCFGFDTALRELPR